MPSVLFICTANQFRSPLAAGLLRQNLDAMGMGDGWRIASAGIWARPGLPALPGILGAAQNFGVDLSGHRSAAVNRQLLSQYDLMLVMQAGQKEALLSEFPELEDRVYLLSEVVERRTYDIPDALGSEQEALEVVAELDSLLRRGVESICVLATYLYNTRHRTQSCA
jgi:protein-tyrosine-phosphatase